MELPEWYWKYGLHDAVITNITEEIIYRKERQNCLTFEIDGDGCIGDSDIETIKLYSYNIMTEDLDINKLINDWWIYDKLIVFNIHGLHQLKIRLENNRGTSKDIDIEFREAEVIRKKKTRKG